MQARRRLQSVLVVLLVGAALLGGAALAHVHNGGTPGLYNAQCPSCELARHTVSLPLSSGDAAPLDLAPLVLPVASDALATKDLPSTASPRAPPLG